MEKGLILTQEQINILQNNDIQFYYYDGFDLFSEESNQLKDNRFEIEFDNTVEYENALYVLGLS